MWLFNELKTLYYQKVETNQKKEISKMWKAVVLSLVCTVILILWWVTLSPISISTKNNEELDNVTAEYNNYLKTGRENAVAFTRSYDEETDQFTNYYLSDDGRLEKKVENFPVTIDGEGISWPISSPSYDELIQSTDHRGFTVKNIQGRFDCQPSWKWDESAKSCVQQGNPCLATDESGTVRGFLYRITNKDGTTADRYHDRRYAICSGNGSTTMLMGSCTENSYYNQEAINPPDKNPCVKYDPCTDKKDGFVHTFLLKEGDSPLSPNQYYACKDKKSVLQNCDEGYSFDATQQMCVPKSRCAEREDGFTFLDTKNKEVYIACSGGKELPIDCSHGVFVNPIGVHSCVSEQCHTLDGKVSLHDDLRLDHFVFPTKMTKCIYNEVITSTLSPSDILNLDLTVKDLYQSKFETVHGDKVEFVDYLEEDALFCPSIKYPSTSFDPVSGEVRSHPRIREVPSEYFVNPQLQGRFNRMLPFADFDLKTFNLYKNPEELFTRTEKNYINQMDPSMTFTFDQIMPFYNSSKLYKPKDPFKLFVTRDGHLIAAILRRRRTTPDPDAKPMVIGLPFNVTRFESGMIGFNVFDSPERKLHYRIISEPEIFKEVEIKKSEISTKTLIPANIKNEAATFEGEFDFANFHYYLVSNIFYHQKAFSIEPLLYYVALIAQDNRNGCVGVKQSDFDEFKLPVDDLFDVIDK